MREHLVELPDGRFFFRYSQEVVAAAYRQMALPPPAWETLRVPTLLVVAAEAKLVSAAELALFRGSVTCSTSPSSRAATSCSGTPTRRRRPRPKRFSRPRA
jgi:hypothetical protein